MQRFLWICLGGAVGTGLRYWVSGWVMRLGSTTFPFGTLAVNLIGSFLLSILMYVGLSTGGMSPTMRLALTTGMLGGFTTYSTFSYETLEYLQRGSLLVAGLNIGLTVAGCLIASLLGLAAGRWLAGS